MGETLLRRGESPRAPGARRDALLAKLLSGEIWVKGGDETFRGACNANA